MPGCKCQTLCAHFCARSCSCVINEHRGKKKNLGTLRPAFLPPYNQASSTGLQAEEGSWVTLQEFFPEEEAVYDFQHGKTSFTNYYLTAQKTRYSQLTFSWKKTFGIEPKTNDGSTCQPEIQLHDLNNYLFWTFWVGEQMGTLTFFWPNADVSAALPSYGRRDRKQDTVRPD